jgi:hypothetical protein
MQHFGTGPIGSVVTLMPLGAGDAGSIGIPFGRPGGELGSRSGEQR